MTSLLQAVMNDFYFFSPFFKALFLIIIMYPLIRYSARISKEFFNKKVGVHLGVLAGSCVYYAGIVLLTVMILHTFGLNVAALLGAAGVLGIAIGFAAQTSVSNIISGIFLLVERPFSINDEIECEGIKGVVEAIDPLSVKLRTQSNQLVRIPNETLIKKSFINHTFYATRRIQIPIKIRSHEQVTTIMAECLHLMQTQENILDNPAPIIFVSQVTALSTTVILRCWVKTGSVSGVEKKLMEELFKQYAGQAGRITIG